MNKKVAIFLPSLRGGGAERVFLNLASGFVEYGLRVDMLLSKAEGPYLSILNKKVRIIDFKSSRVAFCFPQLVYYLLKEQPDALLSAPNHANIIAILAKLVSNVKIRIVVSEHNTLSISTHSGKSKKENFMPLLTKILYKKADKVVAVSQGVADDLIKLTGLKSNKVCVIYNPVITPELEQIAQQKNTNAIYSEFEIKTILSIGRLTSQKDFDTLIWAFNHVRKRINSRLIILGEGEERKKIEKLIKSLGLENDIILPGFVDNPYDYLKRASLFVLSSKWEGLPTVLIEALAFGIPVISTDCQSGPAEILENGKWGSLVPVKNDKLLGAEIIKALSKEPGYCIKNNLKENLKTRFGLNEAVRKYLNTLDMIV